MDRFSATELAEDGNTKIRFTGVKMVHFEDDQTYEVTTPAMRNYEPDRPPVTANANRGVMNAEGRSSTCTAMRSSCARRVPMCRRTRA
jgi:lipopolysaccharide export system protein LptC